jgi:hypothetical protein
MMDTNVATALAELMTGIRGKPLVDDLRRPSTTP